MIETTQDLVEFVEERAGEVTTGESGLRSLILKHLNVAYFDLYAGGFLFSGQDADPVDFTWARARYPKIITLEPYYNTGTVSVTNGSTNISFSDAPTDSLENWYIKFDGADETYRITSHSAGATAATIDFAYTGETESSETFKAFKLRYEIGTDVMRPLFFRVYKTQYENDNRKFVRVYGQGKFDLDNPLAHLNEVNYGLPTKAYISYYDGDGTYEIFFDRFVDERTRVDVEYIAVPQELDLSTPVNPVMPKFARVMLAEYALGEILSDVDDDRARQHFEKAVAMFESLKRFDDKLKNSSDPRRGMIRPRLDDGTGVTLHMSADGKDFYV